MRCRAERAFWMKQVVVVVLVCLRVGRSTVEKHAQHQWFGRRQQDDELRHQDVGYAIAIAMNLNCDCIEFFVTVSLKRRLFSQTYVDGAW